MKIHVLPASLQPALPLLVLAAVSVGAAGPLWAAAPRQRPNVLFIAADDLRNDLSVYGHPLARTPHLDRLARRGLTFDRAYCQQALCNPSRASLLTGRRPDSLGIWDLPTHFRQVDADLVTLPEHFKRHGYLTQNIGKVFHNWRQDAYRGDARSWSVPAELHYATHGSDQPQVDGALPPDHSKQDRTECRDVPDEAYFDGRIAARAVEALGALKNKPRPFFLAVGFWKPHLPFNPPKKYWDLYDPEKIAPARHATAPADAPALALHDGRELLGRGATPRELSREQMVELRHGYLAGISYLDAQVGKLLDALERLELADSTIIVFWSDHGFHLGEHGLWCKTSNFELDARVPLILATPDGRAAGKRTRALVELLDLYPTLVELCGLPRPAGLEGTSLAPLLDDPDHSVKPAAYTQHPRPAYYQGRPQAMGVSVRTERYRYTEWRDFGSGRTIARELYDHQNDPQETSNVADNPPDAAAMAEARRLLEARFPRHGYPTR